MTWSYNVALVNQFGKDFIRLIVGDNQAVDQQFQDEEITALMELRSSAYGVAAEMCRALSSRFARTVDQQAGSAKTMFSQMSKAYALRAAEFDVKASYLTAPPIGGGTSVSDMLAQELDSNRVPPVFTIGMTDNLLPLPSSGPETMDSTQSSSNRPP